MGSYRETCPASEDGCFLTLQWGTSDTIKRGQSTTVSWMWVTPGQAVWNRHRLKCERFQNRLLKPQKSTTHPELWMAESCSKLLLEAQSIPPGNKHMFWDSRDKASKTERSKSSDSFHILRYCLLAVYFYLWCHWAKLKVVSKAHFLRLPWTEQLRCGTKNIISQILWAWKNEIIHKNK